jgi:hypothetical protein
MTDRTPLQLSTPTLQQSALTPDATDAERLHDILYGWWKGPKRASWMTGCSEPKYLDLPEYSYSAALLADHLAGRETYAGVLGIGGMARAGCKDYDSADEAEILAALDTATAKGITAAAFILTDPAGGHTGGHLWTFYDRPYTVADILAQLRTIPRSGKGEDYPSGNNIRYPFGYHKVKRTRGDLVLPDGRRFHLDNPAELAAGLAAFLALPKNGKPEPAPISDARGTSGQAWGQAYQSEQWVNLPDGEPLWHSAYVAAVASRPGREPLAALLRGERAVITKKDDTLDDSDSAQIAALVYNLMSGNVCEPQIRAMALYLKPQIRPNKNLEHYKAHVDAELVRYRPRHYNPQPIRYLGPARQEAPQTLPEAQHKPEPKSRARKDRPQRVAGHLGYLAWLRTQSDPQSGGVQLSQRQCAERLGCNVRTIKRYEKQLGATIERHVFARRQAGCLFILAPDVVTTSPADVVIVEPVSAQPHAENALPAPVQEEHPRPLAPAPDPVAPAPQSPAELRRWCVDALDRLADAGARPSFARVRKYVLCDADGRPVNLATLKAVYANEMDRRRWARNDAREAKKAAALPSGALRKRSQNIASQAATMHRKADPRAPIWTRRAGIYAAEEARRDAAAEQLDAERFRDDLGYSAAQQAELLDQVDRVVRRRPARTPVAARPAGGRSAAGVFPPSGNSPIEPPAAVGTPSSLLAGIRRYHAAQAAGGD